MTKKSILFAVLALATWGVIPATAQIVHDAEYYILAAQNGERWASDDLAIEARLTEIRTRNGGKPPNIVYILLDDLGFGEIGMPDFSVVRGYNTPNINALARQGMSLQRMYTEPSCTPTPRGDDDWTLPYPDGADRSESNDRWRRIAWR